MNPRLHNLSHGPKILWTFLILIKIQTVIILNSAFKILLFPIYIPIRICNVINNLNQNNNLTDSIL
jgi:hypothetical protein